MELNYCDDCGVVLTEQTMSAGCPEQNPNCTHCKLSSSSQVSSENKQPQKSPETMQAQKESLELFSQDTLALKKSSSSGTSRSPSPTSVLEPNSDDFKLPENETLEFFSEKTLALKNSKKSSAKKGRLRFNCAHCSTKLEIKAVTKLSKLICPKCSQQLYIDPVLGVSKNRPQNVQDQSIELPAPKTQLPSFQLENNSAPASSEFSFEEKLTELNSLTETEASKPNEAKSQSNPNRGNVPVKESNSEDFSFDGFSEALSKDFSPDEPPSGFPTTSGEKTENYLTQANRKQAQSLQQEELLAAGLDSPTPVPEPIGSTWKQVAYALLFALSLTLPILLTTLLNDINSKAPDELGSFEAWTSKCLQSLGDACEKAFGKIFS